MQLPQFGSVVDRDPLFEAWIRPTARSALLTMTYTLFYALLFSVIISGTGKLGPALTWLRVTDLSSAVPHQIPMDPSAAGPRLYL